mgnify:CR=1 FL=1
MTDQLRISWHDSTWIPHLNPTNILDYFCQKSNPFYDKLCNNEIARMQKLAPDQMSMMIGVEYILLHVQEPILYVIRKQDRTSPESATPLVDYYILAGVVYQAPDLNSIIQSRVLNSTLNLQSALEEFKGISVFSPSTGYSWKSQLSSKAAKSTERTQRPDEFTRFQMKASILMKSFCENN